MIDDIGNLKKVDKTREPRPKATAVTVRIPVANVMSNATIRFMREKKNAVMANLARTSHHD